MSIASNGWEVQRVTADVASLHALGLPTPARRVLRWCEPTDTQLVLGRAQKTDIQGIRRASGGGAVLVAANEIVWFDVVVPVDDVLHDTDVMRASWWLGDAVARALAHAGIAAGQVYRGNHIDRGLPKSVCFAGLGPGEVTIGEKKIFGISQKRTREAALFQCSIFLKHRAAETGRLLELSDLDIARLEELVGELPDLDLARFEEALLVELP